MAPSDTTNASSSANNNTGSTDVSGASLAADTRNLHWKKANVGLKLLEKMGWKDGQAVGKRQRQDPDGTGVAMSTEGIRVVKRSTGLGLGASAVEAQKLAQSHHTAGFKNLLEELNEQHGGGGDKKKRKKRKAAASPVVHLPTSKRTHHKVRSAKFQEKSADDMKAIFGGSDDFAHFAAATKVAAEANEEAAVSKKNKKEAKKRKKEAKKSKKEQ